jgi:hypothetical protein
MSESESTFFSVTVAAVAGVVKRTVRQGRSVVTVLAP